MHIYVKLYTYLAIEEIEQVINRSNPELYTDFNLYLLIILMSVSDSW